MTKKRKSSWDWWGDPDSKKSQEQNEVELSQPFGHKEPIDTSGKMENKMSKMDKLIYEMRKNAGLEENDYINDEGQKSPLSHTKADTPTTPALMSADIFRESQDNAIDNFNKFLNEMKKPKTHHKGGIVKFTNESNYPDNFGGHLPGEGYDDDDDDAFERVPDYVYNVIHNDRTFSREVDLTISDIKDGNTDPRDREGMIQGLISDIASATKQYMTNDYPFVEDWDMSVFQKEARNYVSHLLNNTNESYGNLGEEGDGLWDNIRDKKRREGKNYRPAKPGSKDRPSAKAWKAAQESNMMSDHDGVLDEYDEYQPVKKKSMM